MKIRRKTNSCLNCNSTLDGVYNYCPVCGQENNNNNVSFGKLFIDFFSNYFALDSRFSRTFFPFLFKPGHLTTSFNEGKRVTYANPVRLYLVLSLFYFFTFNIYFKNLMNAKEDSSLIKLPEPLESVEGLPEDARKRISVTLPKKTIRQINQNLDNKDLQTLQKSIEGISENDKHTLKQKLKKETLTLLGLNATDTTQNKTEESKEKELDFSVTVKSDSSNKTVLNRVDWELFSRMKSSDKLSNQEMLDSLKLGELSFSEGLMMKQIIRVSRADNEQVLSFVLKNVPIMMLVLIPIFALTLKLLYIRRKLLYINHLIHSMHLHAFAYLFFGLSLLLMNVFSPGDTISWLIGLTGFLVVSVYSFFSFSRVYQQKWLKTLTKFFLVGITYFTFVNLFFIFEMLISIMLY